MATHITRKKRIIVILTAAMLVAGGGAAFAYWSSLGNGTGAVATGTSVPFTVTSVAATGTALTPGAPGGQTVEFTVTNTGTGTQNLSAVAVSVATVTGGTWTAVTAPAPACTAADFTVGTPAFTAGDIVGGGSKTGTVTITMKNLSTNQDSCKNVTVPLYIAAS